MDSTLEIVAEQRSGRTVLAGIRGGGHFAARRTGEHRIHLVGTAAGPLGGDLATIRICVRAGAQLSVRSAGATIIQPGRHEALSRICLMVDVEPGARADVAFEPTVVCAGAEHEARTEVTLAGSAQLRLLEPVVLGRTGEPAGGWLGRLHVTRDGRPLLRHALRSGLVGSRVVCSYLESAEDSMITEGITEGITGGFRAATFGAGVAMPLAGGGVLVTATGQDLLPTRAALEGALAAARRDPVVLR